MHCENCLFGFLMSSSTTRLYRGRAARQSLWQFYVLPHMRQSWETMASVSAGHIILTPTQPVGSGRPQRESNPGLPHQESHALPTELPHPLHCEKPKRKLNKKKKTHPRSSKHPVNWKASIYTTLDPRQFRDACWTHGSKRDAAEHIVFGLSD